MSHQRFTISLTLKNQLNWYHLAKLITYWPRFITWLTSETCYWFCDMWTSIDMPLTIVAILTWNACTLWLPTIPTGVLVVLTRPQSNLLKWQAVQPSKSWPTEVPWMSTDKWRMLNKHLPFFLKLYWILFHKSSHCVWSIIYCIPF